MSTTTISHAARLRIIMNMSFEDYGEADRAAFTQDLAAVLGCSIEKLENIRFTEGCVIAEVELEEVAVQLFLSLVRRNPDGTLTSPVREVREFLERHKALNVNAQFDAPFQVILPRTSKQKLVFVHGWGGDHNSFGLLPDYLNEKFDTLAEPFVYPSGPTEHSPSLFHIARALENHIRTRVRAESVGLIAHSMGGLVIRKMLVLQRDQPDPLDKYIRQLIFVASPHLGADLASIAKRIPGISSDQMFELSPYSGFVLELKSQWALWQKLNTRLERHIRSIYGTSDTVVPPADAAGDDLYSIPIPGAGHQNIVKPDTPDSLIVETMARLVLEAGFAPRRL